MPLKNAPMHLNGRTTTLPTTKIINGANFNSSQIMIISTIIPKRICYHFSPPSLIVLTGGFKSGTISIGDIITGITVSTPFFVNVRSIISKSNCTHI